MEKKVSSNGRTSIGKEQIAIWKKEHGDVYEISIPLKDKKGMAKAYLKKPDRKVVGKAMRLFDIDVSMAIEIILDVCWLGGDENIKTDDGLFISAMPLIMNIIDIREGQIVKK